MTDKELRKLSRTELLKLLIEVTEENELLTEEVEHLRAGGATILVDESGRPTAAPQASPNLSDVPASRLEEIFRSAEFAAGKFLKEAQDIADGIIADAEERAGIAPEERMSQAQTQPVQPQPTQTPLYGGYGMNNGYYQQTGYTQNAYGQAAYTQNTYAQTPYGQMPYGQTAYGQTGYGAAYQPGQFYMYQPGMFQQQQRQDVNVSFEEDLTPQAEKPAQATASSSDRPLEGAQGPGDLGSAPTGEELRQVSAPEALTDAVETKTPQQPTDEVPSSAATPEAPPVPAERPKRPPTAMELLTGNIEEEEEPVDEGLEVELVPIFSSVDDEEPRMSFREELASKRDPGQPMSALERLMIAKHMEEQKAKKVEQAREAKAAKKVEVQRNPYAHKPKGFPVPAKPKEEPEET